MNQREIKFRAWDKTRNLMIYKNESDDPNEMVDEWHSSDVELVNILLSRKDYTWMQFTGIHDKNGKEIYEGDIVKVVIRENWQFQGQKLKKKTEFIGWVEFHLTDQSMYIINLEKKSKASVEKIYGTKWLPLFQSKNETIEVIGNIYENSELLKT